MLPCPSCGRLLEQSASGPDEHWACRECGGRAYTFGRMRTAFPAAFFDLAQAATSAGGWRGLRRCHLCSSRLVQFRVEQGGSTYALDFCDHCRVVWFDEGEHEAARGLIPAPPPPIPGIDDPPSNRAFAPGTPVTESVEASERFPDRGIGDLVAVAGLPYLEDAEARSRPWTTWVLAGTIVAASLLAFAMGTEGVLDEWGLSAARPFRHGGLTLATSFLLHVGFWHLLTNAYFLATFGASVEDSLRPGKYLLLVALSSLAGDLLYVAMAHGGDGITVGASGGISGILAYWALAFPRARVRLFWLVWFRPFFYTLSARMAFGLWVALQIAGALLQMIGFADVNHLAHLGGAAVGLAFWYFGPDGPRPAAVKGDTIRLSTPLRWED